MAENHICEGAFQFDCFGLWKITSTQFDDIEIESCELVANMKDSKSKVPKKIKKKTNEETAIVGFADFDIVIFHSC